MLTHSCPHCGGKGEQITKHCGECSGARTVQKQHTLAVHVPAGAPEGYEEKFQGEADENPDYEAGDVIVRVRSKPQSNQGWTRKESGLVGRVTLNVVEVSKAEARERRSERAWTATNPRPYSALSVTLRPSTAVQSPSRVWARRSLAKLRSSRARACPRTTTFHRATCTLSTALSCPRLFRTGHERVSRRPRAGESHHAGL